MPCQAITLSSDSQDPISYGLDDRPALTLTQAAYFGLNEELEKARRAWLHYRIPRKHGPRRIAALAKEVQLRERYEQLLGHPVGQSVPMHDDLPF